MARDSKAADGGSGDHPFPVVGLGASAGGLEALTEFFEHMPEQCGMAFVVVTHQHPGRTSLMPELLRKHTSMPVVEIAPDTQVEPDRIYVSPPGPYIAMLGGTLTLMDVENGSPVRLPIDYFFRSLAQDQRERAIGVVLSGTGTDGTLGIKEIKGAGGMVMVQEEQSARYAGMPHSAIATELVDYILPTSELPQQLVSYARGVPELVTPATDRPPEAMRRVFLLLRNRTGNDFSSYKPTTVRRRIERRMNVHHLRELKEYVRYLQANPHEIDILFRELLIGVTSFFRDPEAFDALDSHISRLLADKPDDYLFRVWVPGCSTGDEAYSLAILLRECMDRLGKRVSVQIFATDLDSRAIDVARKAVYPDGIAGDITKPRLERFFHREDGVYRVRKDIREMVVFAPQNLIEDPPFTKLDLLSCRNLLIYLDTRSQKRLLPIFHYALRPDGLLFLGSSESIGGFGELFSSVDKKNKIFRRKEVAAGTYVAEFPVSTPLDSAADLSVVAPITGAPRGKQRSLARVANDLLMQRLVPASLLVNERGDVVHVHGRTGLYFELSPGVQTTNNIFNMARGGLDVDLGSAMRQATTQGKEITHRGVRVKTNGDSVLVDIRVGRLSEPEALRGLFCISFHDPRPIPANGELELEEPHPSRDVVAELRRELQNTRESHQGTVEELETANEELKSTNEELQSTNEELQSANEELETSKEEMQSLNEELQTVNAELQGKVEELSHTNDDMKNLLNGTHIATIFLDNDLIIKRYTEQATKVVNLIASDIGRPIGDLASKLHYGTLVEDARTVLRTLATRETEVRADDGTWYQLRILPYRTMDNLIDGLVMTFVDISPTKRALGFAESIVHTVADPLLVLDSDLRVLLANRAFCSTFALEHEAVEGTRLYELSKGVWNIGELRQLLDDILTKGSTFEGFEVTHEFPEVGRLTTTLTACRLDEHEARILVAFKMERPAEAGGS